MTEKQRHKRVAELKLQIIKYNIIIKRCSRGPVAQRNTTKSKTIKALRDNARKALYHHDNKLING